VNSTPDFHSAMFDSNTGMLTNGKTLLKVNRQCGRCLAYLLTVPDQIISKNELIEKCWSQYGTVVSDIAVRQAFYQLRKYLDDLNLPRDTLRTFPRQGYRLTSGRIYPGAVNEKQPPYGFTLPDNSHSVITAPPPDNQRETMVFPYPGRKGGWSLRTHILIIVVTSVLIVGAVSWLRYCLLVTELHYTKISSDNRFTLFRQGDYRTDDKQLAQQVISWLEMKPLSEISGKMVYINKSESRNLSFFICEGPIEAESSHCVPVTIIGGAIK